jgi:hypothetical protein
MTYKLFKWDPSWFEQADAFKRIAPDWETELQKAIVSKDTFVALTMGCTVEMVTRVPTATGLTEAGNSIVRATYNKRWEIIHNNIPDGPSPGSNCLRSPHYCLLKEATQLAYALGWQLPKPMLRLISPEIKNANIRSRKDPRSHPKWRKAYEYESEGLDTFYDFIEKNYFDEQGHPIYDKEKIPLKKNLVSSWLTGRTLVEADTIVTSAKRAGRTKK